MYFCLLEDQRSKNSSKSENFIVNEVNSYDIYLPEFLTTGTLKSCFFENVVSEMGFVVFKNWFVLWVHAGSLKSTREA